MMIGPAPMIRMLLMSLRFGIYFSPRAAVMLLLILLMKRSNGYETSVGPGEASGWPWKQKAGLSRRSKPCSEPSNSETWVTRQLAGRVAWSTAKPWFWDVIRTFLESRSWTGWLAPWWPNFILIVFAPEARAMIWWPRQMPKVGMPESISSRVAAIA